MHHPIYLFRHGETHWNAEKRAQGHLDSPLTPAGRAQAEAMGRRLADELRQAGYEPTCVIVRASPLGRVRETLSIAAAAAGLSHDDNCFDHRLREMSWGEWDGLTGVEIEARWRRGGSTTGITSRRAARAISWPPSAPARRSRRSPPWRMSSR